MQCRLIGITGPARVGKSTAARVLEEDFGARVLGFADPLREQLFRQYPTWAHEHLGRLKDVVDPDVGISPRQALQRLGDFARSLNIGALVSLAEARVLTIMREAKAERQAPPVVFDDVRLGIEATWIRAHEGTMIYLTRRGVAYSHQHETEADVPREPRDFVIANDGDVDALRVKLRRLF